MAKIKKYYPGTSGLTYSNNKSVGVLAPQQEDPNKFSTGKFLFPEQKTLANITDRKVMSKEYLKSKGPSFGDKAGNFLENYGGTIANLSTALVPLLLKKKKANERPYKEGTKNLNINMKKKTNFKRYQMGTPNLTAQGTQKSVMDTASSIGNSFQNANQNLVNQGVGMAKNVMGANQNLMNQGAGLLNKANDFNKNMASKTMGNVQNFAQSQMKKPGGALNLIAPGIGDIAGKMSKFFNKGTSSVKFQDGANSLSTNPRFQEMMAGDIRRTSTTLTPTSAYGTTTPAKKATVRQKPAMTAEMQKVARLQQKMKDAGYNIKVDGIWGKETQKIYNKFITPVTNSPYNFNISEKGKGQDVTAIQYPPVPTFKRENISGGGFQDNRTDSEKTFKPRFKKVITKPVAMPENRSTSTVAASDNTRTTKAKAPKLDSRISYTGTLPSDTRDNVGTYNVGDRGKAQDMTLAQDEYIRRNILAGSGEGISPNGRLRYENFKADGAKKVSAYSKLDAKLGGILPGGITRAEAKAMKAAKNASPEGKFGPMAEGYKMPVKPTEGIGPLAGGYVKPTPDLSKPVGEMTDIRRYTNAANMPAATSTKKSLKTQYEENKGGYARAIKSGKKDTEGNLVDPQTGLSYKDIRKKSSGTNTAPKNKNLFQGGKAVKNLKDSNTGISYYTNNRAFDEKSKKMGTYVHDPKTNKINIKWDKPKTAPKRKGDDTYMDEIIDIGSRTIGSLGGAALAGGSTFGVGSVAGGIAGDRAGKAFGNWLNKKLGYREENDTSQEGYSLGEAALGGLGGVGGRLVKPVGGALIKFAGKEGVKMAASPLGRAVAATGRAAGRLVGRGGSKATAQAGGQAASQGASQAASQATSKAAAQTAGKAVNAPGVMSKVVPTRQSSLAVGNTGKIPTKAVRGERGRFTKNPSKKLVNTKPRSSKMVPERPARFNPDNAIIRPNGPTAMDKIGRTPGTTSTASQTASNTTAQAAQNTAKTSISKTKAAARLARQKSKKLITYANNNKKKVAVGTVGGASLLGGGYAASQMRTSGE